MVRKFNHLAILNILYLQAELFDLEDALATEQETDRLSSTKRQCDWDWLFLSSDVLNQDRKQWKLVLEIREKLAEYHSTILQYSQIASLGQPSDHQRCAISELLSASKTGEALGHFQSMDLAGGKGPRIYQSKYLTDLLLLDARDEENDTISRLIIQPLLGLRRIFELRVKKPPASDLESAPESAPGSDERLLDIYLYSQRQAYAMNHIAGALIGAVILIVSMVVPYRIENMDAKVGLVCLFTVLFCLVLSTLSKARRVEIFAATAAFGSIQVVWITQTDHT
ncbi:hypothetical protein UCREL1_5208 [Eutypa lata UCREL1]|uniref:DUF6594 domain-containing protein n=1 Tax=Eutypa lata (strain UCR-EL1) TaxID=1287681 RepID=M7SN13_EUTLA|nr:hypothetical protein UCREL1_5208 [Eutypa lata UCREL1]